MGKKKIGIMGGTFNPIHIGHLILAQTALEQFGLDKVLFMPSKNPPHKRNEYILDDEVRAAMVQLAIEDNPYFELSTFEMEREGITYTADTLEQLTTLHPDEEYFFIVGADSLFYIDKWKDPEIILDLCTLVAAVRDQRTRQEMEEQIAYLSNQYQATIELLDSPNIDISSSMIRERAKVGLSVDYYVSTRVADYMAKNSLYQL